MALSSNLQHIVAASLCEGFGIAPPSEYDPIHEHFITASGKHSGVELLWDFECPQFVTETVDNARAWIAEGTRIYHELVENADNQNISMEGHIIRWGEMFRTLYRGALDHVMPLERIRTRISELTGCPKESTLLFDILTPDNGKSILYHHDHPVLLHLAYTFRRCPSGRWIDTYDGFGKSWLALNYLPLSLDDAANVSMDPTQQGIDRLLKSNGISRALYDNGGTQEEVEAAFQRIRGALRELNTKRADWISKASQARRDILASTAPSAYGRAEALIRLIGAALELNEDIHHRVYLGLNVLRLIAQAKGEVGLKLSQAFSSAPPPGTQEELGTSPASQ
jgi:hypothetical protein